MHLLVIAALVALSSAKLAPYFEHEKKIPGEYLVVLKPEADLDAFKDNFADDVYISIKRKFRKVFKGYEATMKKWALKRVREHADVQLVEDDMIVEKFAEAVSWGLDRVDQRNLPLDGQADFPGTGTGTTAYIIDTGIYPDNMAFGTGSSSRAAVAFDAFDGDGIDCNGHGTHVAGTIGGDPYGIARDASLRGVRVLSCLGFGSTSDVVAGMDYVAENAKKPAVASMSLGGGRSPAMDEAIRGLYKNGVATSVAAGNDASDACLVSPAGEPLAITVGATDVTNKDMPSQQEDVMAYFSNYGTCVDIFAPGVDILSAWIGSPDATNTISGTSMACPHVTGAACVLLGQNPNLTPQELADELVEISTKDTITDLPRDPPSPNKLLYIGKDAVLKPSKPDQKLRFKSSDDIIMKARRKTITSNNIIY